MSDEPTSPPATPPAEPKGGGALGALLGAVKLDWVRPLIWKLGGRKLIAGGGGLAVINEIVKSDMGESAKIIVSICAAVVSVGVAVAIAIEDKRKGKE